jgi:integrase
MGSVVRLREVPQRHTPVRRPNHELRTREHLTEREVEKLIEALRHATGFKLANDGHDTRAIQAWLGHKNMQHVVRYTEMAPNRFLNFWRD